MKPCCKSPRLVHFNRGSHGHIWSCIACGYQHSGPAIPKEEMDAVNEFAKFALGESPKAAKARRAKETTMNNGNGIQLTFNFNKGVTPHEIAEELRAQADLFNPGDSAPSQEAEEEEAPEEEFEEAPKKKGPGRPKKEPESFDDEEPAKEEAEEEPPVAPAKKAKPPTKDDVNEACKAHAKRHSFEETKALLQKKFKTTSVGKLDAGQYTAVIAAMKG